MMLEGDSLVKEIRIENVRSLKDTGWIPLKPVTLLVGQNSAGKSTFLRTFPLLKQSIRKRTDGPLLWVRDVDDYVDFGSFSETIHRGADKDHQYIRFSFKMPADVLGLKVDRRKKQQDIEYSIVIQSMKESDYVSHLYVRIINSTFEFDLPFIPPRSFASDLDDDDVNSKSESVNLGVESVKVDGQGISLNPVVSDIAKIPEEHEFSEYPKRRPNSLFGFSLPSLEYLQRDLESRYKFSKEESYHYRYFYFSSLDIAQGIGQELCRGTPVDDAFFAIKNNLSLRIRRTPLRSGEEDDISNDDLVSKMHSIYQSLSNQDKEKDCLIFRLFYFYAVFRRIEDYLGTYYRQVHYVAPVRATAERYYRLNNVSIDEVDFQGVNVPQFLAGMTKEKRIDFEKWTKEHFGIKFYTEDLKGVYTSVKISAGEKGNGVNLADTGFGYSQILPIIIQLWESSGKKRTAVSERGRLPLVIAIEQPELHLHPNLQDKLVRALIAAIDRAKKNGRDLQLLLETHSETIVNSFGLAIADEKLSPRDVSVALFDRTLGEPDSSVRSVRFTKEGYLEDWPVGFFVPDEE